MFQFMYLGDSVDIWQLGPTPHLSGDALEEYVFDRLPAAQATPFEDHLLVCALCRGALEETERFIWAAKVAAAEYQANPRPGRPHAAHESNGRFKWLWKPVALASAVGLALVMLWATPSPVIVASVELVALRGGTLPMAHAPHNAKLDLKIDLTGLPLPASYRIEIVAADGSPAWEGLGAANDGTLVAHVAKRLASGTYWVRLYRDSTELLREFGLKLG